MFALCEHIAVEKDPRKFSQLLEQLNNLLQRKEYRLKEGADTQSPAKATPAKSVTRQKS